MTLVQLHGVLRMFDVRYIHVYRILNELLFNVTFGTSLLHVIKRAIDNVLNFS